MTRSDGPLQPSLQCGRSTFFGPPPHVQHSQWKMLLWVSAAVAQACLPPVTCHQGTVTVKSICPHHAFLPTVRSTRSQVWKSSSHPPRDSSIPAEGQEWIQAMGAILGASSHSRITLTKSSFLECPGNGTWTSIAVPKGPPAG